MPAKQTSTEDLATIIKDLIAEHGVLVLEKTIESIPAQHLEQARPALIKKLNEKVNTFREIIEKAKGVPLELS